MTARDAELQHHTPEVDVVHVRALGRAIVRDLVLEDGREREAAHNADDGPAGEDDAVERTVVEKGVSKY